MCTVQWRRIPLCGQLWNTSCARSVGKNPSVCDVDKDLLVSPVGVKFPCVVGGGICAYPVCSWVKMCARISPVCSAAEEFPCVIGGWRIPLCAPWVKNSTVCSVGEEFHCVLCNLEFLCVLRG